MQIRYDHSAHRQFTILGFSLIGLFVLQLDVKSLSSWALYSPLIVVSTYYFTVAALAYKNELMTLSESEIKLTKAGIPIVRKIALDELDAVEESNSKFTFRFKTGNRPIRIFKSKIHREDVNPLKDFLAQHELLV